MFILKAILIFNIFRKCVRVCVYKRKRVSVVLPTWDPALIWRSLIEILALIFFFSFYSTWCTIYGNYIFMHFVRLGL